MSERHACRVVKQPRGTQRYRLTQRDDEDTLTQAIVTLASQYGRYGYRRITARLRRAGWQGGQGPGGAIWRRANTKTPSTHNRYKAFLSLCYRLGNENDKVDVNPAKKVRPRKEAEGRQRYYSHDEYNALLDVIKGSFPEHAAEFIVAVHTGMRLTEQYTCIWSQVNLDRREITLHETKNGSSRKVQLNDNAVEVIRSLKRPGQRPTIPRQGPTFDTRSLVETLHGRGQDRRRRPPYGASHVLLMSC
jgi:integrase